MALDATLGPWIDEMATLNTEMVTDGGYNDTHMTDDISIVDPTATDEPEPLLLVNNEAVDTDAPEQAPVNEE
jgi:hypothetical protein